MIFPKAIRIGPNETQRHLGLYCLSMFQKLDARLILVNPYKPGDLLWDIGKQNSPRCDAAKRGVASGAILFVHMIFIEN